MISNNDAVSWVIRACGEGAIASRTKIEIDAPIIKLKHKIKYGLSRKKLSIASIAIANKSINNSINLGGSYRLDRIKLSNQKDQNLIVSVEC